jgi:hypothetical protein
MASGTAFIASAIYYRTNPFQFVTSTESPSWDDAKYILTLCGVYILALIIDALAPTFSGEKNINQAFKLAT